MAYSDDIIKSVEYVGLFKFENPACIARCDIIYEENDEETYNLKVKHHKNKNITFAYKSDVGLKKIDNRTKKESLPISDIPLSAEAIAFAGKFKQRSESHLRQYKKREKSCNEYIKELEEFFRKYGYIKTIESETGFMKVEYEHVQSELDILYFVTDLMSECNVDEHKRDYNKIFHYTFSILLKDEKDREEYLEYKDDDDEVFFDIHPIRKLFWCRNYRKEPRCYHISSDNIKGEIYSNSESDDNQEPYDVYATTEYFMDDRNLSYIRASDYNSLDESNYDSDTQREATKRIKYGYLHYKDKKRDIKLVFDFLFHFIHDVVKIEKMSRFEYDVISFAEDINLNKDSRFTKRFKEALYEIAVVTVKRQIEHYLLSIHPSFEVGRLTPGWCIPDLLTAMYFSLFLGNGSMKIHRVCANPNCCNLYPVIITNKKQKYCSDKCRAAASQRSKRYRKALEKEGIIVETDKKTTKSKGKNKKS